MSKEMCKPETIGAIADYIWDNKDELNTDAIMNSHCDSLFHPKLNGNPCDRNDIYQRLWNMNVHAVTIGYTDHAVTEAVGEYELYPQMPSRSDGGIVKKFDYFIEQCDVGEIPMSIALYEVRCAEIFAMAFIARATKEYEEESWE